MSVSSAAVTVGKSLLGLVYIVATILLPFVLVSIALAQGETLEWEQEWAAQTIRLGLLYLACWCAGTVVLVVSVVKNTREGWRAFGD